MNDEQLNVEEQVEENAPDESGTFSVESHIKIFDPETGEVFVNQR